MTMKVEVLLESLRVLAAEHPGVTLVRNKVGNLAILDSDGEYTGWVDLGNGSYTWMEDEPQ